jgi:chromosome segregation ATPase
MDSSASQPQSIPDALRAAAAAVAGQQAILDEQEARLREREEELAREEQQVAERLAAKHQQFEELQQQLAAAREQHRREREQLDETREESAAVHRESLAERDRLRELRPKFIRRLKRQWTTERKDIERRTAELARRRRDVDDDATRLTKERSALQRQLQHSQQLAEQQQQRLHEEAQALAEAHARFAEERRANLVELERRERQAATDAQAVEAARRQFEAQRPELEKRCEDLRAEARGLEQRISSARRLLARIEAPAAKTPAVEAMPDMEAIAALLANVPESDRARLTEYYQRCQQVVRAQAAQLADQRTHLGELYERLTRAEAQWEQHQAEAVAEMERLCAELQDHEEALRARLREVEATADRQRQERERVNRLRAATERNAAEFAAKQLAWHGDRDRLHIELDERLGAVAEREEAIANLFHRWRERRKAEINELRHLTRERAEARDVWERERDEFHARSESLRIAQQALVEQALALEEARREFLKDVERPDLAAKRIERLHRRWEGLAAASQRELRAYRDRLADEDAELRQIYLELERQQEALARRERDLAQRMTELENARREVANSERETETSRQIWEEQRRQYERQLAEMRAELEHSSNRLAGDDDPPAILAAA